MAMVTAMFFNRKNESQCVRVAFFACGGAGKIGFLCRIVSLPSGWYVFQKAFSPPSYGSTVLEVVSIGNGSKDTPRLDYVDPPSRTIATKEENVSYAQYRMPSNLVKSGMVGPDLPFSTSIGKVVVGWSVDCGGVPPGATPVPVRMTAIDRLHEAAAARTQQLGITETTKTFEKHIQLVNAILPFGGNWRQSRGVRALATSSENEPLTIKEHGGKVRMYINLLRFVQQRPFEDYESVTVTRIGSPENLACPESLKGP
jgi:hypothetical protein